MSLVSIARTGRKKLFVEKLEDRCVPDATLISQAYDVRGNPLNTGVNDDVQVLGRNDVGNILLVQSAATNVLNPADSATGKAQDSPPLQNNLFLYNTDTGRFTLISGKTTTTGTARYIGVGAVRSTPGQQLNAVLSADGTSVAFLSTAPAPFFGDAGLVGVNDAGGADLFVWQSDGSDGGRISLASKDVGANAIGGYAQVSNPAISRDGSVVSFVSTADARIVTASNDYYDQAYDVTRNLTTVPASFTVPTVITTIFGTQVVNVTVNSYRYLATAKNTTPDLFRTVVGQSAVPVSYTQYDKNLDITNGFAIDLNRGTDTGAKYLMHGDVTVDPLGRYMNAFGNSFVVTRKSSNFSPTLNIPIRGLGEGLWKYTINGAGTAAPTVVNTPLLQTTATQGQQNGVFDPTSFKTLGTVTNPIQAANSGDIVFAYDYDTTINYGLLTDQVVFIDNFVDNNGLGVPDLYLMPTDFTNRARRQLITSQIQNGVQTRNQGMVGALYAPAGFTGGYPGAYQVTPDGTKVTFAATAPSLGYTVSPTDPDAILLVPVTDNNGVSDVFQRDVSASSVQIAAGTFAVNGATFTVSVATRDPNNPAGTANNIATSPGASYDSVQTDDGLSVAFVSEANLTRPNAPTTDPNTPSLRTNVYLWERLQGKPARLGARPRVTPVSNLPGGVELANTPALSPTPTKAFAPLITGGFRQNRVFFQSNIPTLDPDIPAGSVDTRLYQLYGAEFPVFLTTASRTIVIAADRGTVTLGTLDTKGNITTTATVQPFGSRYKGEVRVALADVNGDGVLDLIAGAGFGAGPQVSVIDGFTTRTLNTFFAFESTFRGGVYVSGADLTGDGRAEVIVGAGEGGAPRVQVYDGATDALLFDRFAYEPSARTGVRVAAADVTGDSIPDLVLAAGIGGGPRVRVFDGATARTGQELVFADFFAYEDTQRGGVYIAAGDYDGDGYADILTGGGPDGGPRVTVFNGFNIQTQNPNLPLRLQDFFAFDPDSRDGARPAFKNVIGQKNADIVVGTGNGPPIVRVFNGTVRGADQGPQLINSELASTDPLALFGAWVG